jgi:hypothetical protein
VRIKEETKRQHDRFVDPGPTQRGKRQRPTTRHESVQEQAQAKFALNFSKDMKGQSQQL